MLEGRCTTRENGDDYAALVQRKPDQCRWRLLRLLGE